mmetsp:Transcript_20155/g.61173  ORF Transcript_20155/g.61173 Transcript_20155/m.61173 type:complete len:314 (+) Transcript_20155:1643-2584(+)
MLYSIVSSRLAYHHAVLGPSGLDGDDAIHGIVGHYSGNEGAHALEVLALILSALADVVVTDLGHPPGFVSGLGAQRVVQPYSVVERHLLVLLAVDDERGAADVLDAVDVRVDVEACQHARVRQHAHAAEDAGVHHDAAYGAAAREAHRGPGTNALAVEDESHGPVRVPPTCAHRQLLQRPIVHGLEVFVGALLRGLAAGDAIPGVVVRDEVHLRLYALEEIEVPPVHAPKVGGVAVRVDDRHLGAGLSQEEDGDPRLRGRRQHVRLELRVASSKRGRSPDPRRACSAAPGQDYLEATVVPLVQGVGGIRREER